jgi:hypothetical protein
VDALLAAHAATPPFFPCPAGQTGRACLVTYLNVTVISRHTRFKTIGVRVVGETVFAQLEVRNDLTRAAGVERFKGVDRVTVRNGTIVAFAFLRDLHDPQTAKFFDFVENARPR